jgi:hypothetical protein
MCVCMCAHGGYLKTNITSNDHNDQDSYFPFFWLNVGRVI